MISHDIEADLNFNDFSRPAGTLLEDNSFKSNPDSKVHGANMGPTWVLSAPDGPHEPCYQGRSSQE